MRTSPLILLVVAMAGAGCTSSRIVAHPEIQEPEIRRVVDRVSRLKPGMTKIQVWNILGRLPLEDKVVWIQGGSDWGEGTDAYLLTHGYSLRLLWDQTDYHNWKYRRAWVDHENRKRIEL
jgi:hypothetical protein